jgi:hypothetical protein
MSVGALRNAFFATLALLGLLASPIHAQALQESMDVVVNGPQGALLLMDGQAKGTLPLPVNLSVPAGSHRFRLQLGKQAAESDPLSFQGSGQAELNLTLSGRTLVATLRITDGLLWLRDPSVDMVRSAIADAVAQTARKQHSVLISGEREALYLSHQKDLFQCFEECASSAPLVPDGQVSYALSLRVENGTPNVSASCLVRTALLDLRTREVSARAEEQATPCRAEELSAIAGKLTSQLLQDTLSRPRGAISVTSTPPGAQVRLDGRLIGTTPLQQEVFSGARVLEVSLARYITQQQSVSIESGETATSNIVLVRVPDAPLPRPKWRIITGSVLLGAGLLMVGFGGSALSYQGKCQDELMSAETCSPYYETKGLGLGLVGAGAALTLGGVLTLAIPSKDTSP